MLFRSILAGLPLVWIAHGYEGTSNFNRRAERPLAEQACFGIINSARAREDCLKHIQGKKVEERLARFCLFEGSRDGLMQAQRKLECVKAVSELSATAVDEKRLDAVILSDVCGRMALAKDRMACLEKARGKKFTEVAQTVCQTYPLSARPIENNFSTEDAQWCLDRLAATKVPDSLISSCFERTSDGSRRQRTDIERCLTDAEKAPASPPSSRESPE